MAKCRRWYEVLISALVVISLLFSFTNYVYVSAVSAVTLVFAAFVFGGRTRRLNDITIRLFWFFFYCAISVLLTNPRQLIDFGFYRYDGNLFITFAPLLVLSMSEIRFDTKRILFWFVTISSIANLAGMVLYFAQRPPEYAFFFTAHNAAGGFLAMLVVFNGYLVFAKKELRWISVVFLLTNLLGLYLTNSRGSLLPLVGAVFVALLMKKWAKADLWLTALLVGGIFVLAAFIASVRGDDVIIHYDEYQLPAVFAGSQLSSALGLFNRSWTMVNRLYYLWPKAVYLFGKSPFFGVGFGTFNDNSYNWVGFEGLAYLNVGSAYVNGSNHAHNSYLHILTETGIFGFALFTGFLLSIRKSILKMEDKKLAGALLVTFLYAAYSGLFEHRLTTPAQMIPFVLLLGMEVSNSRACVVTKKAAASLFAVGVIPTNQPCVSSGEGLVGGDNK